MSIALLLALAPFILFLILLLWKKTSLLTAAVGALLLFTVCVIFYWHMEPLLLSISYAKGFLIALDIFVIIFGAIFFLAVLKELHILDSVSYYLQSFSADYRVQLVVLAWFFGNFLEGTAGFGTPVAVVAPLLIAIGLSPIRALAIGLLGNSVAGVFGAAGTPIRVGFSGLDVASVPMLGALFNFVGILIPVFMIWIAAGERKEKMREFVAAVPFALWSGGVFFIASLATVFLGQEFPSIVGSMIGLLIVFITTKRGWFVPKTSISLFEHQHEQKATMSALKAFSPYVLLVALLLIGKFLLGSVGITISSVKHAIGLFNPGFVFIIIGVVVLIGWKRFVYFVAPSAKSAFKGAMVPFLIIGCTSTLVQLLINSGVNTSGVSSGLSIIARYFEVSWLPLIAPFAGAFGSFVTGSVTIANIMFGNFLSVAAQTLGMSVGFILALALVGGAIGNMVALADMVTGEAVVGVKNKERDILKLVILPCLLCLALVGIVGMLV